MKEGFVIIWEWAIRSWKMVLWKYLVHFRVFKMVLHYELLYLNQFFILSAHYLRWNKLQWSPLVQRLRMVTWKFKTDRTLIQGIKCPQNHWRTPGKVRSFKLKDINVLTSGGQKNTATVITPPFKQRLSLRKLVGLWCGRYGWCNFLNTRFYDLPFSKGEET